MADGVQFQSRGRRETTAAPQDLLLVDAEYVETCLGQTCRPTVLLEAHFTSPDHPPADAGSTSLHIPGAIEVHPSYLEAGTDESKYYPNYQNPADGNLLADKELALALQKLGITPETLVIVYGAEPDGAMAAARLVWALMYAGVREVRLLDGGLDAWLTHGGESINSIRSAARVAEKHAQSEAPDPHWRPRPELLATSAEVADVSQSTSPTSNKLVDVRESGEWTGSETHHYPFFSKAGHIPTAEYQGDWDNLVEMDTHRLAPMLEEVARRWREQGIIDEDVESRRTTLIFYCGTGWRSSIAVVVALLLGLRAKNYDDGFYGWSWDEDNEIVYGDAEKS